ncbi:MAG: hypothetical protein IT184_03155 [Acidobacteria bacterium]|nr:hypothetical protein [Acidobacteriota bacterium]
MRVSHVIAVGVSTALVSFAAVSVLAGRQAPAPAAAQADASRAVTNGGVFAAGWTGAIDASEEKRGLTLQNARLSESNGVLSVTTGPAATYWNPKNVATGVYTVKATFYEPKYMNLNDHPHPYGIVIAGSDMGTPDAKYLYCAAYGNGVFIVRGFGPAPFQMGGRRGMEAPSVARASGPGAPVTQEIAMSVTADAVTCTINGSVVGTYPKSDLVGPGKLKSTDGVYGIRFAHNTEGTVTGLSLSR